MIDVHTIGAGGGSIGWLDEGGLLHMGPQSAGADPGPACYGRGGTEPTCTDADLVLGYLDPDYFLGGRMRLDADAAREQAIERRIAGPLGLDVVAAAAAMLRGDRPRRWPRGTKDVALQRGYDPRELPLVVAGGAGAVHAGRDRGRAEHVDRDRPAASPRCCARSGMLLADLRHDYVRSFTAPLGARSTRRGARAARRDASRRAWPRWTREGVPPDRPRASSPPPTSATSASTTR